LALAVGPVLGGLLTQHVSGRILINVPTGIGTMALEPPSASPARTRHAGSTCWDWPCPPSRCSRSLALIEGHDCGWTSGSIGAFSLAAVSALAFIAVERRSEQPMVDVSLLRPPRVHRRDRGPDAVGVRTVRDLLFTSLYLQGVLGFSDQGGDRVRADGRADGGLGRDIRPRGGAVRCASLHVAGDGDGAGIASTALLGKDATFLSLMPSSR
jgi:hypothetical protein